MNAWYNEIEPFAAQWIENLAAAGHVAAGPVERRSIVDLRAADIPVGGQRHFFAGVGGWSAALRLAGWPDDLPVWTGSCPCQPFSDAGAGRRRGFADERHLWPNWFELIREHRPAIVFGEQVASPDGLTWFDAVSSDLEGAGYAVGAADLCAAGIGAPHRRQRLYFAAVADAERGGRESWRSSLAMRQRPVEPDRHGAVGELGNAGGAGSGRDTGADARAQAEGGSERSSTRRRGDEPQFAGATRGFWSPAEWIYCRDEKWRPVEPGAFPLAHGVLGRVGKLRGYGNAIVPELAATFIEATIDWLTEAA